MNPSTKTLRWAALAALALATTAQAAFLTFSNAASFLSALFAGSYTSYTEGFIPQSIGYFASPQNFSGGAPSISYTIASTSGFYGGAVPGVGFFGNISPNLQTPLVVSAFSRPINAIGGYFFATESNFSPISSALSLTLTDGNGTRSVGSASTSPTQGPGTYFGFISTTPITSFSASASGTGAYVSMSALTVGFAPVPEPAEYAAVTGLALGVFALVQRRRQAAGR